MEYIYKCAQEKGECLITPIEILNNISFDLDFREEEIEPTMKALQAEQYFSYDHVYKNDQLIYAIVLKEKAFVMKGIKEQKGKNCTKPHFSCSYCINWCFDKNDSCSYYKEITFVQKITRIIGVECCKNSFINF